MVNETELGGPGGIFEDGNLVTGHDSGSYWLEVPIPYMFGLFFRPMVQGISPENMAWKMVLT